MIRFVEYTAAHTEAVESFNHRLRSGGMTMQYPTQVIPNWLPPAEGSRLFQEHFVGVDEHGEVRAGFILKHQDFKIGSEIVPIADLRLPISEGSVSRDHASLATELLFDALSKQRLLFGMGIGGYDEAVAKLFQAAGWRLFTIPFFFRVQHPFRFCRRIRHLRRSWLRRAVLDAAAFSGVAALAAKTTQAIRTREPKSDGVRVETVEEFGDWADEVWKGCQREYGMIAVREADVLRLLYPADDSRFIRLKVSNDDGPLGWVVMLDTQMTDHKQFGSLRVGTIVDGLAPTSSVRQVVRAATDFLAQRGVDLMVSNQSHAQWCDAFGQSGFLSGPSNYLFAASRALSRRIDEAEVPFDGTMLNRGDGDGPINL